MAHNLEHELQQQVESTTSETGEGHWRKKKKGEGHWWIPGEAVEQDPSAGYASALANVEAQREQDYGGVFQMFGEQDLFTKITKGMRDATGRDIYQPFMEMQRGGSERTLLDSMKKIGTTGFAGSTGEESMMDALQGQYAQASVGATQQAAQQQSQAQQALDSIVRQNQQQSLQLRQMEEA